MTKEYQRFKNQRNYAFWLAVAVGLSYLSMLVLGVSRVFSGFVMQLIFLGDYLRNPQISFSRLFLTPGFVTHLAVGLGLLVLVLVLIRGLLRSVAALIKTRRYINSLTIIERTKGRVVFKSNRIKAFTGGFFRPTIYISEFINRRVKDKSPDSALRSQAKAMIFHETGHRDNFDPLKDFVVDTLKGVMPGFLQRNNFFAHYQTMVELTCDYYAQTRLASKKAIIEALAEIIQQRELVAPNLARLKYFTEAADRVRVLTNQAYFKAYRLYLPALGLLGLIVINTVFLNSSKLFDQCDHLADCVSGFWHRTVEGQSQDHQGCQFLMDKSFTVCSGMRN